jgi:hypothetical protein
MYTKENYLEDLERTKQRIKELEDLKQGLKDQYIEENKPCKIGDYVNIVLNSGRKVKGEVVSFGILKDGNVHVTHYKDGSKNLYITSPNLSIEVIND